MTEKTLSRRTVFQGRALQIDVLDIELPGGRRSVREIVCHRGAVVVLAERADGRFVLVRQYRSAIGGLSLEMVAGCLEPGEPAETAARRELEEESGYVAESLRPLGVIVPCPGYSSERLHLFHARVGQAPGATRPDFDEQVEPVVMTAAEIDAAIADGTLQDAKSIALWHLARPGAQAPAAAPRNRQRTDAT
jgi:ADP-ribose pyrophosphatase